MALRREAPRDDGAEPMNERGDESDGRQEIAAKRSISYWVVGLLLLVLAVVVAGAAFALNAAFRPKLGTEPVATANVQLQPTAVPLQSQQPTAVPTGAAQTISSAPIPATAPTIATGVLATPPDQSQAVA